MELPAASKPHAHSGGLSPGAGQHLRTWRSPLRLLTAFLAASAITCFCFFGTAISTDGSWPWGLIPSRGLPDKNPVSEPEQHLALGEEESTAPEATQAGSAWPERPTAFEVETLELDPNLRFLGLPLSLRDWDVVATARTFVVIPAHTGPSLACPDVLFTSRGCLSHTVVMPPPDLNLTHTAASAYMASLVPSPPRMPAPEEGLSVSLAAEKAAHRTPTGTDLQPLEPGPGEKPREDNAVTSPPIAGGVRLSDGMVRLLGHAEAWAALLQEEGAEYALVVEDSPTVLGAGPLSPGGARGGEDMPGGGRDGEGGGSGSLSAGGSSAEGRVNPLLKQLNLLEALWGQEGDTGSVFDLVLLGRRALMPYLETRLALDILTARPSADAGVAYLVSRVGARKLLEGMSPSGDLDTMFWQIQPLLNIFASAEPIFSRSAALRSPGQPSLNRTRTLVIGDQRTSSCGTPLMCHRKGRGSDPSQIFCQAVVSSSARVSGSPDAQRVGRLVRVPCGGTQGPSEKEGRQSGSWDTVKTNANKLEGDVSGLPRNPQGEPSGLRGGSNKPAGGSNGLLGFLSGVRGGKDSEPGSRSRQPMRDSAKDPECTGAKKGSAGACGRWSRLPEAVAAYQAFVVNLRSDEGRAAIIQNHLMDVGFGHVVRSLAVGVAHSEVRTFEHLIDPDRRSWMRQFEGRARRFMTQGEVGCALSHFFIWVEVLRRKLPAAIVLEDDVEFPHNTTFAGIFQRTMRDINILRAAGDVRGDGDVLFIGRRAFEPAFETYEFRVSPNIVVPQHSYQTHAYMVTYEGARKLVASFFLDDPVDILIWKTPRMRFLSFDPVLGAQRHTYQSSTMAEDQEVGLESKSWRRQARRRLRAGGSFWRPGDMLSIRHARWWVWRPALTSSHQLATELICH